MKFEIEELQFFDMMLDDMIGIEYLSDNEYRIYKNICNKVTEGLNGLQTET